jgi:hypothetical protein
VDITNLARQNSNHLQLKGTAVWDGQSRSWGGGVGGAGGYIVHAAGDPVGSIKDLGKQQNARQATLWLEE